MNLNDQENLDNNYVEDLEVQSQMEESVEPDISNEPDAGGLSGIGGFLIFAAIGRVISPVILICAIFNIFLLFTNGTVYKLSQPGSLAYSNLWMPITIFELCYSAIFLIIDIGLLYLFFNKKKLFPKVFICLAILSIISSIIDAFLMYKIQSSISVNLNMNPGSHVLWPIIGAAIWIPYFLTSTRVKNTFVR